MSERPEFTDRTEHVRWVLAQHQAPMFALLDAARHDMVLPTILQSGLTHRSLYEGWQGEGLSDVAPYLVEVPPDAPFLDAILELGWGDSWGTFLFTTEDFFSVRRHLRRFLKVQSEDGKRLLFRFYDPRVLRGYLPTCTPDELAAFMGPISWWVTEGPHGETLLRFTRGDDGVRCDTEPLPEAPPER